MKTPTLAALTVLLGLLVTACSDASPSSPFDPLSDEPAITPFVGGWVSGPEIFSSGDHAIIREFRFSRSGRFAYAVGHFSGCREEGDALECDSQIDLFEASGTFAVEGSRCEFSVESTDFSPLAPFYDDCSFELTPSGLLFRFQGGQPSGPSAPAEHLFRRGTWLAGG